MTGESIKKKLLATTLLVGLSGGIWAGTAMAQDSDAPIVVEEADEEALQEKVVVTGSRIKRDSFTSTSPLQVLTAEVAADSGLFDTASIVTSQPVFQGVQVGSDISAGGFVTVNGPGTNTVSLRGLGASRTLVLINGRRLAPAGVGGAPSNPNINFVPSSLIQSVDTITDGASAVYGSDAIAGAVNFVLRDEFDGFRIDANFDQPQADGGENLRLGATWGTVGDRGSFLVAAEYFKSSNIQFSQRDFTQSDAGFNCILDIEIDTINDELARTCNGAITNVVFTQPGFASPLGTGAPVAGIFNAIPDLDDLTIRSTPFQGGDEIRPAQERISIFTTGNVDVDLLGHTTNAFIEVGYSNIQTDTFETFGGQIFPGVPADNPFNPFGQVVTPVFNDPVFRGRVDSEIQQTRIFTGFNGDVDFFADQTDFFNDWTYEIFGGYTRSLSTFQQPALLEENLALSLGTTVDNGDGTFSCGFPNVEAGVAGFLTVQDCVPVNLFASSLFSADPNNPPTFATQEELDFLTGVRSAGTIVDQTIFGGFVGGPVYRNPLANADISILGGFEWREDSFNSGTDTVNQNGLAAGFSEDPTSLGTVDLFELYGEILVPIVRDKPFIKELTFEGSVRWLNPEFTSSDVVYSLKGAYRPVDWLLLRGTYGTSYRAPNANETFLAGVTAFASAFADPCVVPLNVTTPGVGAAAGGDDPRVDAQPNLFANCIAQGVDPTSLGLGGAVSVTTQTSGNNLLEPEQSTALTAGFVVDQPFTDWFDASLSVSYFDIEIEDAPAILGAGAILGQCLNSPAFPNEPACDLFGRDPATGFVDVVQVSPLNLSLESVEGVDINISAAKRDINAFGREWGLGLDFVGTYQSELNDQLLEDSPIINDIFTIGNPAWRWNLQSRLSTGPWSLFYRLDFIGATRARDLANDQGLQVAADGDFEFGGAPTDVVLANVLDPTTGLNSSFSVGSVDEYYRHTLSARYAGDGWSILAGISNLTDVTPPQVDANVPALDIANVPAGVGFDTRGRSFFVNLIKEF